MARLSHLIVVLLSVTLAAAAKCTTPGMRKSWHKLSNVERGEYITAVLCLMGKPAKLGLKGAKTRFDDFHAIHALQAYGNHYTGSFLPFHRLFLQNYEDALRDECKYTGYQPYWQQQIDAGKYSKSILLDATYGFGGNGAGAKGCIPNGPFANYTNTIGPGYEITNHCIDRKISDVMSQGAAAATVNGCMQRADFTTFWPCIEGQPHSAGHAGIGGQMNNGVSSPGDPIFWLHHAWLDKLYADWQARDKPKRLAAIGGTNIGPDYAPAFPPRPASIPKATGAAGDPSTITTLAHILNMHGNGPNRTIEDVMDVQGDFLCYRYADP